HRTDWVMRATGDLQGRAVQAWRSGLLDRLSDAIVHGYLGCAQDGDGWAILLEDLSGSLIPSGDVPVTVEQQSILLEGFASLHDRFWAQPEAAPPDQGFCTLEQRYRSVSLETSRRERGGPDPIPPLIESGWDLFWPNASAAVRNTLQRLQDDPTPLCRALARYPQTVLHGDSKMGNLGITREPKPRAVFLDWAQVGTGPPSVELGWYLAVNSAKLPGSKEQAIAEFQERLASRLGGRFDDAWWQPQLELGLLGGFLQLGWAKALGAYGPGDLVVATREQREIDWWASWVEAGARRLE
ncbi:MAG: phosphotransferase, partial [Chloroflexota bacterium]